MRLRSALNASMSSRFSSWALVRIMPRSVGRLMRVRYSGTCRVSTGARKGTLMASAHMVSTAASIALAKKLRTDCTAPMQAESAVAPTLAGRLIKGIWSQTDWTK